MAQLMRCTDAYVASRTVKIVSAETADFTVYVMEVTVGRFSWFVKHRYREFLDMHERLVHECRLEKNIFPPKKMFGKTSGTFIAKRQAQLEFYIQTVLLYLFSTKQPLPQVLTHFLDFPKYEIHGITEMLAEYLYSRGDWYLVNNELFTVQTLQLHAIHQRLKLAEPTCESGDKRKDLGHVLDFITRVRNLKILGSRDPVWNSNIDMNQLAFDMTVFRNLETLHVVNVNVKMCAGVEVIKRSVRRLYVRHSISALEDLLLRDICEVPLESQGYLVPAWSFLKLADFSHNDISSLDQSVKLLPKVECLSLSHNQLVEIQHLASLSCLAHLDLSHNKLRFLDSLHTKLGNLKTLNLSGNQISSLQGLSKLYSLEALDLQGNDIAFVLEVQHISSLPCLEHLTLTGNPVTVIVDYRTKVFELFSDRAGELYLDNHKPTQKERDTVAILQAIQKAREGRERAKRHVKKPTEVPIREASLGLEEADSARGPSPGLDPGSGAFQQRVESIRAQVGESWLSLLNEMQEPAPAPRPDPRPPDPGPRDAGPRDPASRDPASRDSGPRYPAPCDSGVSGTVNKREPALVTPAPVSPSRYTIVSCGVPTNQPGISNSSFITHLHQLIASLNVSSHIPGITGSPHDRPERVVYLIWAICLPYSQVPSYPACCVLTNEMLHIFRYDPGHDVTVTSSRDAVTSQQAVTSFPRLSHVYSMVVGNVQEIVVGYRQLHFRLEEAFIGPQGTFCLVTANPSKTLQFITYLKDSSSIAGDDVIVVQDFGDVSERQLLNLLTSHEGEQAHIVHYIHVQVTVHLSTIKHALYSVCLTRNYLYLLEVNPVHFPSTTFNMVAEGTQFTILQQQSLQDQVVDVTFNNDLVRSVSDDKKQSVYGLTLTFDGETIFQCVFPSPELRDLFLCQLMQLRRQLALRQRDERDGQIDGQSQNSDRGRADVSDSLSESEARGAEGETRMEFREMTVSEYSRLENWHVRPERGEVSEQVTPSDYPSSEFLNQLTVINQNVDFIQPLPSCLQQLASLSGEEMFNYFHDKIADIGLEGEQLRHVVWTNVIPYVTPDNEMTSLVLLSTRTLYFISDKSLPTRSPRGKLLKAHRRNQSDSFLGQETKFLSSLHHRSGVLHLPACGTGVARCYLKICLNDVTYVNVNLEETSVRVTSAQPDTTVTLMTRNADVTNAFTRQLASVLTHFNKAQSPEHSSSDSEQDFYKMYAEKPHDSKLMKKVEFLHAKDDIFDLQYLLGEKLCLDTDKVEIHKYLPVFLIREPDTVENYETLHSRTLVLCSSYVVVIVEDYVNYPIPDFVPYPPGRPRHEVSEFRRVENLKRITVSDFTSNDLTLVFDDVSESLEVDPSYDHYSSQGEGWRELGEARITVLVNSIQDKNCLLSLISEQWSAQHEGQELSIQVNA